MYNLSMSWIYGIIFFILAFSVTCALVPFVMWLSQKTGAIDLPSERRVHKKAMPRLGGVAIFIGIFIAVITAGMGTKYLGWELPLSYENSEGVNYILAGIGVLVIFITGIVDDIKCLTPKSKLFWQIVASVIVCISGLLLNRIMNPFTGEFIEFGILSFPITILFLVAFANIINLIDGLDGLAAGISAITALTIFILSTMTNKADAAILSIAIFGGCIAFLIFNFHPAKLFMGDSGSLTLGFLLGVAALLATTRTAVFLSMMAPILAAGVPVLDTLLAILRRKRQHKRIDEADKGHIHHKLLQSGLSQRKTVLIMWGWSALLSVCGIVITFDQGPAALMVVVVTLLVTIILFAKLHLLEPILKHHYHPRNKENRKKRDIKYGIYNRESDNVNKQ